MDRSSQVEGKYVIFPSQQTTNLPIKGGGEQQQKVRRRRKRVRQDGTSSSEGKKRRLTEEQAKFLEMRFWEERKLESGRKAHLATELGIDPKQVAVWFQNRRARSKNKQLEEEYARLKSDHETNILHNRHLESEVLRLKEQIAEAEKEIRKLSGVVSGSNNGGGGEVSSSSPSTTSFSMDTSQVFHGGIGEEGEELIFINEYNNYVSMLDWSQKSGM